MSEDDGAVTEARVSTLESTVADLRRQLHRWRGEAEEERELAPLRLLLAVISVAVVLIPVMVWLTNGELRVSGWSMGAREDEFSPLTALLPTLCGLLGLATVALSRCLLSRVTSALTVLAVIGLALSPVHRTDDPPYFGNWDHTGAVPLMYLSLFALAALAGALGSKLPARPGSR